MQSRCRDPLRAKHVLPSSTALVAQYLYALSVPPTWHLPCCPLVHHHLFRKRSPLLDGADLNRRDVKRISC